MSIFEDVRAIDDLAMAGASEQSRGERIANAGRDAAKEADHLRIAVEEEKLSIQEAGNIARALMAGLQDAITVPLLPVDPPKPARQTRPPRPHVSEGRASPLTDDLRAKLNATLAHGPLQLPEILKFSWTAGLDLEALLCEDGAAYVCWQPEEFGGLDAWGTAEDFYGAFKMRFPDANSPAPAMIKSVADRLGCSAKHAADAIDRARREAGAG